ncbi:MAG: N-formylglutamate amidohydrolase [Rubrivivax sp.]|nr:N-formylglutamate amidohydrolase [Rubrivivax sp.]
MDPNVLVIHGPRPPEAPAFPIVLDSPHSGFRMPADFGAKASVQELRDGEDAFIDELYLPAAKMGIPLLTAQFPRTYIDVNRHTADIDAALMAEPWPTKTMESGKAKLGKALVWRTLVNGKPIYDRKLGVAEVMGRIERYHQPYHDALWELMANAHTRFGIVYHINCHSMGPTTTLDMEGVDGQPRPDFILGDRDGTTCEPAFTNYIVKFLQGLGYSVVLNNPFKGVELVRAYSDPSGGRHSLQIEINKKLYMDPATIQKHEGFNKLQGHLMQLMHVLGERFGYAQTMIRPRR